MIQGTKSSTVCIVGGGSSAHVLISFLSQQPTHTINLLTRRPDDWCDIVTCEMINMENDVVQSFVGKINKKSNDPEQVIPDADVIILCMPVHQYRGALNRIGPFINKKNKEVFIGTIYGQAGFNWMVHEIEKTFNLGNLIIFAIGLIPWICRTISYGSKVANYGAKQMNIVAVNPRDKFEKINELFLEDLSLKPLGMGKFVQACSFLSLTLSVDNQIIHPARCYGLWTRYGGRWPSLDSVPYFYKDFDEVSSQNLKLLDDEYTLIRDAIRERFPDRPFTYMLPYLDLERLVHDKKTVDIMSSFRDSKQLGLIKPPVVINENSGEVVLDINSRFFTDDVPFGLVIAKWIAEKLDLDTPFITKVIMWSDNLRNEHWIDKNTFKLDTTFCIQHKLSLGIPPSYGIDCLDLILD